MVLFSLGEKSPGGKDSQCVVVRVCPGARGALIFLPFGVPLMELHGLGQ